MKAKLRILFLEDSDYDGELVQHALRSSGLSFQLKQVDARATFLQQLVPTPPDLILSDFSLPGFDGMEALALARKKCPAVPFIFVTGTVGEEVAIETLKKGATDYVLKHRLARLVPSVHRALREARERAERQRAEWKLHESFDQLRQLSTYLQTVREEERTRIAREVHDELGQALTGLKLQLTWVGHRLPENSKGLHEKLKSLSAGIDATIQAVRRIATALRPGILDTAGLVAAIEWQAQEFETQTGIQCRVHATVAEMTWDQDLNTAFFRIFQETLTNVIRHANATVVDVDFFEERNDLVLQIKDNGVGIAEAEIHKAKSIGLLGMRERAGLLGGHVRWLGTSGRGTTVTVRIPRPDAPAKNSLPDHANPSHRRPRRRAAGLKADSR